MSQASENASLTRQQSIKVTQKNSQIFSTRFPACNEISMAILGRSLLLLVGMSQSEQIIFLWDVKALKKIIPGCFFIVQLFGRGFIVYFGLFAWPQLFKGWITLSTG